jgi:hypothetical protein
MATEIKSFSRADEIERASLADVATWQGRQAPPPPGWVAPVVALAVLAAIGVVVMAGVTVWEWAR